MGRTRSFRIGVVASILATMLSFFCCINTTGDVAWVDSTEVHFTNMNSINGVENEIKVLMDMRSKSLLQGERFDEVIIIENKGEVPVDLWRLSINNFMIKIDNERCEWLPLDECNSVDNLYESSGIEGFCLIDDIEGIPLRPVTNEMKKWKFRNCVRPGYLLYPNIPVVFQYTLKFHNNGHWRLYYRINGDEFYKEIVVD